MAKASDNIFARLILAMRTTNTTTPSDSSWHLFAKANGVFAIASNGVAVGPFAAASSGSVTLITDTLLGSDTANFDFTSIPGTYKHLKIIITGRSTNGGSDTDFVTLRFNNDSGANYYGQWNQMFQGQTTTSLAEDVAATSWAHCLLVPGATSTTGAVGTGELLIADYASTTFHKSISMQGMDIKAESTTNIRMQQGGAIWASTAAVTRITLAPTGNFKTGTRASLYGIS